MRDRGELSLRSVMSIWLDESAVMLRRFHAEGGVMDSNAHKLIIAVREAQAIVASYIAGNCDPSHYTKALMKSQIEAAEAQRASENKDG